MRKLRELVKKADSGAHCPRGHVERGALRAYVRVTQRWILDRMTPTIDVASVDVKRDHRGHGIFTAWLADIEALAEEIGRTVFVESVLNDDLARFLAQRGYVVGGSDNRSYCRVPSKND